MVGRIIPARKNERRGGCLTPIQRMETRLGYLADTSYQTSVAEVMGITQPTVSRCIADTKQLISAEHANWIKFPTSAAKLGFPYTLGAIDCTHVRIEKPGGPFGDDFINRKNFASFNVQATCNENYLFTSVDVGWPGSVHDSRIFQTSELCAVVSRNVQGELPGDSGYGLAPYLMTPYADPNTQAERHYNIIHARNRVVIAKSFGQLKRRFPILRYGVRLKLESIPNCIMTCFVLHNVSKFLNDPVDDLADEGGEAHDKEGEDVIDINLAAQGNRNLRIQGQQFRLEITTSLFERNNN